MDLDLSGRLRDDPVPGYVRRLRPLARLCGALALSVVAFAVLIWVLVRQGIGVVPGLPAAVPLSLSLLAAMLILLSSRFRSSILRKAFPRSAALGIDPEAVIAAYQRATRTSFVVLEAAALVGLFVALTSGSAGYGIVLCIASLFGMLTRWPRASEVDRLVRGRAAP
ncbi:MAG TPA: hypothetical protein VKK31_11960 [Thermoanaerobaculia bacterium]|nr:hypothetical protein [Thermoanaerobaculia bacterium]